MADDAGLDPRITPVRPDLAAESLRGRVVAPRFAAPRPMRVAVPIAPLTARPDAEAALDSQLLLGEGFDVYDSADGWAWGQAQTDGYVGYVPAACLGAVVAPPTHRVTIGQALIYPEPSVKSRPIGGAPLGALLRVAQIAAAFCELEDGGFIPTPHLCPVETTAKDWVAVAMQFQGAPYLWGGRTVAGIDCSGLVQVARQAAGLACPRDSDMQRAFAGENVPESSLRRGDLVFWKGHVGIMLTGGQLLHANAHHMAVAIEPLARAVARIEKAGGGPVVARRRWTP
jgi:hypothetical protein